MSMLATIWPHYQDFILIITDGHFLPYGMDWFSTYGQNIHVPIFTYSAILPYAYIEELKSKILEIPLDVSIWSSVIKIFFTPSCWYVDFYYQNITKI